MKEGGDVLYKGDYILLGLFLLFVPQIIRNIKELFIVIVEGVREIARVFRKGGSAE